MKYTKPIADFVRDVYSKMIRLYFFNIIVLRHVRQESHNNFHISQGNQTMLSDKGLNVHFILEVLYTEYVFDVGKHSLIA